VQLKSVTTAIYCVFGAFTIANATSFSYAATLIVGPGQPFTTISAAIAARHDGDTHDASVGHEVKSRALVNIINHNRIVDGPTGTASYSIDLPNGGIATITNNQIEQGPASQNPIIISIGEEGPYAMSTLALKGNLIENDLSSYEVVGVRNDSAAIAQITNTRTYRLPTAEFSSGPADVSGTTVLLTEPAISSAHPWAK
jgi:hypothetical protein